jgi:hypothetical protein
LRDVGILQIFTSCHRKTIVDSPTFSEPGLAEKIAVCAYTYNLSAEEVGGLDGFLYEAAQKSFQIFMVKIKKSKTYKWLMSFSRPIKLYHAHADLIWPDGTFKST